MNTDTLAFLASLIREMDDNESWQIVTVVEAHEVTGNRQENETFGHEYVDQSGPGIMGDDYQGHIYFPIGERYLKIWYAC